MGAKRGNVRRSADCKYQRRGGSGEVRRAGAHKAWKRKIWYTFHRNTKLQDR
jgi:hypothetical protein